MPEDDNTVAVPTMVMREPFAPLDLGTVSGSHLAILFITLDQHMLHLDPSDLDYPEQFLAAQKARNAMEQFFMLPISSVELPSLPLAGLWEMLQALQFCELMEFHMSVEQADLRDRVEDILATYQASLGPDEDR